MLTLESILIDDLSQRSGYGKFARRLSFSCELFTAFDLLRFVPSGLLVLIAVVVSM